MNSNILLLATIIATTLVFGQELDHKEKASHVKSQMQNIKEEKEFMKRLESKIGTKKGFPDLRESIEDAFENDALPEMIENIEAHHDKAEQAENDDDLEDLEAPRSSGKADARPGWPCSRRRWWGGCATRRRVVSFAINLTRRRSLRLARRRWGKDMRQ